MEWQTTILNVNILALKKLLDILDNDEFQTYLKKNEFEQFFNPFDSVKCQYSDENEFISANRNGDGFLKYFLREYPQFVKTWWWTSKFSQ